MKRWIKWVILVILGTLAPLPVHAEPQYTLGFGGFTVHGYGEVDPSVAKFMPNRIDDGGYFVLHPTEISLTYKNYYHYTQHNLTVLRDCFDWWAVMLGSGFVFSPTHNWDVGILAGLYARHEQIFNINGQTYQLVGLNPITKVGNTEVIPIAFLTTGWRIFNFGPIGIDFNLASNWYISHAQLGLTW